MRSILKSRPFETADSWGRIEYGLHYIPGNRLPYFTVTVREGRYKDALGRKNPRARDSFGGCMHDTVARVAPDLRPLIALHLSDVHGAPVHWEANGWYWLAGACGGLGERYHGGNSTPERSTDDCLRIFAEHARITVDDARAIRAWIVDESEANTPKGARVAFGRWAAQQLPRFKAQALEAIRTFGLQGWAE